MSLASMYEKLTDDDKANIKEVMSHLFRKNPAEISSIEVLVSNCDAYIFYYTDVGRQLVSHWFIKDAGIVYAVRGYYSASFIALEGKRLDDALQFDCLFAWQRKIEELTGAAGRPLNRRRFMQLHPEQYDIALHRISVSEDSIRIYPNGGNSTEYVLYLRLKDTVEDVFKAAGKEYVLKEWRVVSERLFSVEERLKEFGKV